VGSGHDTGDVVGAVRVADDLPVDPARLVGDDDDDAREHRFRLVDHTSLYGRKLPLLCEARASRDRKQLQREQDDAAPHVSSLLFVSCAYISLVGLLYGRIRGWAEHTLPL